MGLLGTNPFESYLSVESASNLRERGISPSRADFSPSFSDANYAHHCSRYLLFFSILLFPSDLTILASVMSWKSNILTIYRSMLPDSSS